MADSAMTLGQPDESYAFDGFYTKYLTCPPICCGHVGETSRYHTTAPDFFGPDSYVHVVQDEGDAVPKVIVADLPRPVLKFASTHHARLYAYQVLMAADYADRHAVTLPTADAVRRLAEVLAASGA